MGPNFSLQGVRVEFFWSSFWKYMGRLRPKAKKGEVLVRRNWDPISGRHGGVFWSSFWRYMVLEVIRKKF